MFRGGKIPDIEGYQSPIQQFVSDISLKMENDVYTAVQNVGIFVDKDELIKALQYDREQYDKGYADGYEAAMKTVQEALLGGTDDEKR